MRVLGGTRFVGRAVVEEALGRGSEVTTSNRGQTGVDVVGVEAIRGTVSRRTTCTVWSLDVGGSAAAEATWSVTQYGTCKAGCERAVVEVFGDRALVLRPGVILGPHENVGRLTSPSILH